MSDVKPSMKWLTAFVALWAAEEALTGLVAGRFALTQVVWMRFALHLALLAAIWGWRDPASLWRTRRPVFQLVRGAMMVAMPACWVMGMQRGLSPATLMSVFWLAPLMMLAMAQLFLGERVSRRMWLAAAVACVGVFALTGPHSLPRPLLLVFPLGMALSFSSFVVMTRALRHERVQTNLFYIGLSVCLLLSLRMPAVWVTPGAGDLLIHLGIAVLGLGGLFALERLTSVVPVARSAPLVYLQIPFAVGIGWGLEQQNPGMRVVIGLAVIGAVVAYAWRHTPSTPPSRLAGDTGHGSLEP